VLTIQSLCTDGAVIFLTVRFQYSARPTPVSRNVTKLDGCATPSSLSPS